MSDAWPFADPQNVAVFTVRQIARDGHPILRVVHDIEDGAWQFLEWEPPRMEDAMLVCLKNVVSLDPSIRELADLPMGWRALRRTPEEQWHREPNTRDGK
jgi:hypothetical protein